MGMAFEVLVTTAFHDPRRLANWILLLLEDYEMSNLCLFDGGRYTAAGETILDC